MATTATAPDGSYGFPGVAPGSYTLEEAQPAGFGSSTPDAIAVTVPAGGLAGQDFGETAAVLSGSVYVDAGGDGVRQDGEAGIGGVTVMLAGTDVNGLAVRRTTVTEADGAYRFAGLIAGTYTLTETQPAAFGDGLDAVGSAGGTTGNDVLGGIPLGGGEAAAGYVFGERGATLAGTVFVDATTNGIRDPGEVGLGGVAVTLFDAAGNVVAATTTAADGSYRFDELPAGGYTLVQTQPIGFGSSTSNVLPVMLTPAGTAGRDFGETTSSLAGSVYFDADNDGLRDAGEPGIGGVAVVLAGTDAAGNPVNRTTTTAPDGSFRFDGLLAGTYSLGEAQPAAFADGLEAAGSAGAVVRNDAMSAIGLGPGIDATGYTFGETELALVGGLSSLFGTVYVDADADGVRDPGEAGLGGVTLTLLDAAGNVVVTTTTAADGSYRFDNLPAGSYTLVEGQPGGYGSSTPNTVPVTLAPDGQTGLDFGETTGTLAGAVYNDLSNNGVRDPNEPGIGGVTITLTGTDVNGGAVNRATTTAADGSYSITGLLGGTYTLTETQPAAFADGLDATGTAGGTVGNDAIGNISLGAGVAATGYIFGERGATLSGTVYIDANTNGTRDGGEAGLGGVTITLRDANGVVATTTTAADGSYRFDNLPAGNYTLESTDLPGYGSSTPDLFAVALPATGLTGQDFGETTSTLAGAVYNDLNNNGVRDPGEAGIGGVTITLSGTDVNGSPVSRTATTAADGSYSIPGLLDGTYTLTEAQPAAFADGLDAAGTAGGTVGNDAIGNISLGAGVAATGYIFGERGATLSGTVYIDANTNGTRDGGEAGLGGVIITLRDANGVVATTTTAADGSYSFPGLPAGSYTLESTDLPGYGSSTPDLFAVALPATGLTGQDFGETTSTLAGAVYIDLNNNGVRDPGEAGIGGVTITLSGTDVNGSPVSRTATTAADGSYSIPGLLGGTYTVTEAQPASFTDGLDAAGTAGGTVGNDAIGNISLGAGVGATGYNFGERGTVLSGTVYIDANTNGTRDGGEVGLGGVTITLRDASGVIATTVTAADGSYSFPDLPAGSYTLESTDLPGYGSSTPDLFSVALPATGLTGQDFGETTSTLAGAVYNDLNNNGVRDPNEPGIGIVTVTLSGTDVNGGAVNRATTTAADGSFRFTGLLSGTYRLTEAQPQGFLDNPDNLGTLGGTAGDDVFSDIVVGPGALGTGYNFGELVPASFGSPSDPTGFVFLDSNGNGVFDPADRRLPGVLVTLTGTDDRGTRVVQTQLTRADGSYSFDQLRPGTYTITETQPAGFLDGPDFPGNIPSIQTNDQFANIVLGPGDIAEGYHFSEEVASVGQMVANGSLSGTVYYDLNHNGVRDEADFGIAGVVVTLTGTDDLGNSVSLTTATAADGTYTFAGLRPGVYSLREAQPGYFRDFRDNIGSLGGTNGNDLFSNIVVGAGSQGVNYDFGELQQQHFRSLRWWAIHLGRTVDRLRRQRAQDPARFDARHSRIGAALARGEVPRGVGTFPRGARFYTFVPTIGTKVVNVRRRPR